MNILLIIAILLLIVAIIGVVRTRRTYLFCKKVNDMSYNYTKNSDYKEDGYSLFFNKLPSPNRILFSFNRIRLKTYFTESEIKQLTNNETTRLKSTSSMAI